MHRMRRKAIVKLMKFQTSEIKDLYPLTVDREKHVHTHERT